ncbi:hypothetical protein CKJ65_25150 [Mycobacterium intracellulare]|uniref:aldo/keto reductase n=1 Tax=Mycobacterium intracellulare TaxID=1767 RepID=UPI000BB0B25E|nr:aldo/keto reductase [Mycobacterium intracellulare]PBA28999.1 hypothetical protein CKJ65_25150 [Mycobacterium intracellulare]
MATLSDVSCPFGIGTALGPDDDNTDEVLRQIIHLALSLGIRVFDTAVNYRAGRSERVLGQAIAEAVADGRVARSDIVVMTKGGYPRPGIDYDPGKSGGCAPHRRHCLDPAYISDQIDLSLSTLGVGIDVYYLHNPEEQTMKLSENQYWSRLASVVALLEEKVSDGSVASYGVASWCEPADYRALDLARLCQLADDVSGGRHHLTAIEAPLSLFAREVLRPCQKVGHELMSLPSACATFGIAMVASASAGRGRSPHLAAVSSRWAASVPGVTLALAGTLSEGHLHEIVCPTSESVTYDA